jgi:hypothetical protein
MYSFRHLLRLPGATAHLAPLALRSMEMQCGLKLR